MRSIIFPDSEGSPVSQPLIAALQNPALFPHPVEAFQVIETHISWVLLTGPYAYKIKKPVNFGFLDFTQLDARSHFCNEELRLNPSPSLNHNHSLNPSPAQRIFAPA